MPWALALLSGVFGIFFVLIVMALVLEYWYVVLAVEAIRRLAK